MPGRLTPLDASFLYLEDAGTPLHTGTVMVFPAAGDGRPGLDHDQVTRLVAQRTAGLARYRQRVRSVGTGLGLGLLGSPVWTDDPDFDLTYHVRRVTLPRPGGQAQLEDFLSRVLARTLARDRPLWEAYLVEGLEDDSVALVTKTHQAMLGGDVGTELAQLLLREEPAPVEPEVPDTPRWVAEPGPSALELALHDARALLSEPGRALASARRDGIGLGEGAVRLARGAGHAAATLVQTVTNLAPASPLNTPTGAARRIALVDLPLAGLRSARSPRGRRGNGYSVHDVVLACVAGALRDWMLARGEPLSARSGLRVMVPLSVEPDAATATPGSPLLGDPAVTEGLVAVLLDLPVGEPNARMRLEQVAHRLRQEVETGRAVGADRLAALAGFGPATLHALAARAASAVSRRLFNLVVVNAPGPQHTLYAGPAPMLRTYPLVPLVRGQALAIGLTSYDGTVYVAFDADAAALPDLDLLAQLLADQVAELTEHGA